jgi:hypothetical protein
VISGSSVFDQSVVLNMSDITTAPTKECNFLAIDIPLVGAYLTLMNSEIIDASLLISKIHKKSVSLEECICNSPFVNLSVHKEATDLKESVDKLGLGMSEIQERMTRLKTALSSTVVIPPILSTDDDISLASLIAVNGPTIDWSFAEAILKRYLFLGTENLDTNDDSDIDTDEDFDADFCGHVWNGNDFDSSVATLLNGGDCWRVRKSLELLVAIVDDQSDLTTCIELFEALAFIILKRQLSSLEDEELKWAYLIANNQAKTIDHGILRWINSFLYSQKEKNNIALNAIRIMYTLFNDEYCESLMSTLNIIQMYNQSDYI